MKAARKPFSGFIAAETRYPFSIDVAGRTLRAVRAVSGSVRMSQWVCYGDRRRLDLRSYLPSEVPLMLMTAKLMLRDMAKEDLAGGEASAGEAIVRSSATAA